MAYDALKNTIRQYIKTNGEQEITGQILQNILIAMVNEYPSLDGYLPLSGGTMTGNINMNGFAVKNTQILNEATHNSHRYNLAIVGDEITIGKDLGQFQEIVFEVGYDGKVQAESFKKYGGTSSQFLKADGSVDSSTYALASALSGYLPLSGGTMTGNLGFAEAKKIEMLIAQGSQRSTYLHIGPFSLLSSEYILALVTTGAIAPAAGITSNGGFYTGVGYVVSGGTSSDFLKADGSLDSTSYLPLTGGTIKGNSNDYKVNIFPNGISAQYSDSSIDTDTITEIRAAGIYFKETDEEFIRIYKSNTQLRIQLEEGDYASLRAGSFVKQGGTSIQFLKADGSVDSNAYITSSALSGYATQSWVGQQGYITSSALDGYATQSWVGQQGYITSSALDGYATQSWVEQQGYITSSALDGYATQSWVGQQGYVTSSDLDDYLPLSGGSLTGTLTINATGNKTLRFGTDGYAYISRRDNGMMIFAYEYGDDLVIGNKDNQNYTIICNDLGGGLADSNYELTSMDWNITTDGQATFVSVTQTSDMRYKDNIGDLSLGLESVANAPLFKFTWKNEQKPSGQHVGSSAQYWQTVLPELVSPGTEKMPRMGMQYDVIALASAITVAREVVNLQNRMKQIENILNL